LVYYEKRSKYGDIIYYHCIKMVHNLFVNLVTNGHLKMIIDWERRELRCDESQMKLP